MISGLRKLRSFTVSGSYAYFVDTLLDDLNLERGAQLKRAALSGGAATPLTLTTLGDSGSALSVQGSYVYTTLTDDTHSSQVGRVPLLSGTSVEAVSGSPNYINAIRTNSTHAFGIWSLSQQHFTRVPLAGGTSNHIAQTPTFDWIDYEVDETFAYFLSPSGVARAPVEANDGGGSAEIGPAPQTGETFNALSVAGQGTVVIATNQRLLAVTDFSKDGSPIAAGGYFANVVADADYAYFFMGDTESCLSSKLYEIPLDGGTKPRHLATTPGCPSDAVLGSEGVYWTSPMRDAIVHAPR